MKNINHFLLLVCMFIPGIMFCSEDDLLLEDREVVNLLVLNDVMETDAAVSMFVFMLAIMENQPILCTKHVWLNFARFVQLGMEEKGCDTVIQKDIRNVRDCIQLSVWPRMLDYLQNNYKLPKEQLFEYGRTVLLDTIDEYWKRNSFSDQYNSLKKINLYQSVHNVEIISPHAFAIMKASAYECKQVYQKGNQDFLLFIPDNKTVYNGLSQVFDIEAAPSYDYSAVVYGTKIQRLISSQIASGKSFLNDVLREKSYAGSKKIKELSALPRLNMLLWSHGVYKPDAPQDSYINEMPPKIFNECLSILQGYYNMQSLTVISCYAGGTIHRVLEEMQKKHTVDISYPILLGAALNTAFIIDLNLTCALSVRSSEDIERSFKEINGTYFYVPVQRFVNNQIRERCGLLEYFFSCVQDKDWNSAANSLFNTYSDRYQNQFIMKQPFIDRWFNPFSHTKGTLEVGYVKAQAGPIDISKYANMVLLKAPYYPYELTCFENANMYFAQFSSPEKIAYYYIKKLHIKDLVAENIIFWIYKLLQKQEDALYNARVFIEHVAIGEKANFKSDDAVSLYIEVIPAMQSTSWRMPNNYNYLVLKNNIVTQSSFKESENIDFQAKIREVKEQALLQNQAYWGDQATDKPMFDQVSKKRVIDYKESKSLSTSIHTSMPQREQALYALNFAFFAYKKSSSES